MRNRGDVSNDRNVQANGLNRTNGGLASGAGAFNQHFNLLQAMSHGLPASVLGHQLSSVSRTFTGSLETDFPRTGPTNDIARQIGDRNDRIVKGRENMSN